MESGLTGKLDAAWGVLAAHTKRAPRIAVVLGSGLGDFVSQVKGDDIPFQSLPGFPVPTVSGHSGKFRVGDFHRFLASYCRLHGRAHPPQQLLLLMAVDWRITHDATPAAAANSPVSAAIPPLDRLSHSERLTRTP